MNIDKSTSEPLPPDAQMDEPDSPSPGAPGVSRRSGRKRRRLSPLAAFLIKLAAVAVILTLTFIFVLGVHVQHGARMYPHIKDGDLLVTFKLEEYRVDDVVVYRRPDTGEKSVGRIKAKGENEIRITESGELMVNGVIIETERFYPTMPVADGGINIPYHMGGDGFFLLNDYRSSGSDSRLFGELKESDLLGKVVYVFRRRGI